MPEQPKKGSKIGNMILGMIPGAIGMGIDWSMRDANDRRQLEQQQKLQDMQLKGNKEMAAYNRELAMKTWNETNYAAQRAQLEKAKLNVGLMYGGTGAGGQTTSGGGGSISGASAPMGGGEVQGVAGMALQAQMMQAQIANTNANTEKTKVEAAKIGGVDTQQAETTIDQIKQTIKNAKAQEELTNWQTAMAALEVKVNTGTANERVENAEILNNKIIAETNKTLQELRSAEAQANVDQATQDEAIKQLELLTMEKTLNIELQKAGIQKTKEEIHKICTEIYTMQEKTNQGERALNQEQQKIALETLKTEFNFGAEAGALRWLNTISGLGKIAPTKK